MDDDDDMSKSRRREKKEKKKRMKVRRRLLAQMARESPARPTWGRSANMRRKRDKER